MSQKTFEFTNNGNLVMANIVEDYGKYTHELLLMFKNNNGTLEYVSGTETNNKITLSYDEKMINMMRPGFIEEVRKEYEKIWESFT